MPWLAEQLRRLRSVVRRDSVEAGLDEEIRFHLERQTEKYMRAGMPPQEARRRAYVRFGGVEHMKEQTRDEFRPALFPNRSHGTWRSYACHPARPAGSLPGSGPQRNPYNRYECGESIG